MSWAMLYLSAISGNCIQELSGAGAEKECQETEREEIKYEHVQHRRRTRQRLAHHRF